MAKVVYWCIPPSALFLNSYEPEPLIKEIKALRDTSSHYRPMNDIVRCPALHNHIRNTFVLRSPIDLSFYFDGETIKSESYSADILDHLFLFRDVKAGFVSLGFLNSIFFTEEDCNMTLTGAYLNNNDTTKYFSVIPGVFNISRWFRNIDFAFYIREKNKEYNIKKGDALAYIKFDCNDQIILKKFYLTKDIEEISDIVLKQKIFQQDKSILTYMNTVYNLFDKSKIKNRLIAEIKKNLME